MLIWRRCGAELTKASNANYERMARNMRDAGLQPLEPGHGPQWCKPSVSAYQSMIHTYAAANNLRCASYSPILAANSRCRHARCRSKGMARSGASPA